jgi:hypothetical protein
MKKLTVLFLAVFLFSSCNVFRANDILDADFKPSKKGQVNVFFTNDKKDYALQNVCSSNLIPAYFYQFEVENDNCTELRLPRRTILAYSYQRNEGIIEYVGANYSKEKQKSIVVAQKIWKNCSTVLLSDIMDKVFISDSTQPAYLKQINKMFTGGKNIIIKFN